MYLIRLATRWFFVKLLFVCFIVSIRTSEDGSVKKCEEEQTHDVLWPVTAEGSCSVSQPMCLNANFEISQRCCTSNQTWDTQPICGHHQRDLESPCPHGSVLKEDICIFVVNTTYPPKCPYEETVSFDNYFKYVDPSVMPIWLPVERDRGKYGEGLFYWKEYSEHHGTPFNLTYNHSTHSLLDNNCLIYHRDNHIENVACTENHSAICAYTMLSSRTKSFCAQIFDSSCKQSDYSTKSKCFCRREMYEETNRIELLVPYQNLLYTDLDQICYIGLDKKDDLYIWKSSNVSINYTYWSVGSKFGQDYMFGAMSSDGWLLKTDKVEEHCTLIQKSPVPINDEISLTLIGNNTLLAVPKNTSYWKQNLDNTDPMIFCFTDTISDNIVQRIDTERYVDDNKVGFKFSLTNNGPGNYWCEGFLYPELTVQKSEIYFDSVTGPEYVALLWTTYSPEVNPLSHDFIIKKHNLLAANLQAILNSQFYPRIYKIVEINEMASKIILNFHVTTKSPADVLGHYSSLRNALSNLPDFKFENLLSVSVCIGTQTVAENLTLTWPTTNRGETALKPREGWCVDKDGTIVTRSCEGNFIDGASWLDFNKTCLSLDNVDPNLVLNQIVNVQNPAEYMTLVREIASNNNTLNPSDIDLIASYVEQLSKIDDTEIDINEFVDLIDAVININETDLKKSQEKYNSTDRMLDYIPRILKRSNFTGEISRKSVSIVSFSVDDYYSNSILWRRINDDLVIVHVNLTDSDLLDIEDFDSGLVFNRELLEEVTNVSNNKIIIVAYFKGTLFNEDYLQRYTSTIFNIILPNFKHLKITNLDNLVVTVYNGSFDHDSYSCSYWRKDEDKTKGFWYHKSQSYLINSNLHCNFKIFSNIGMVTTINITMLLEEFLYSPRCSEDLNIITLFLDRYVNQFQAYDVLLISKLIIYCSNKTESVTRIIDKVIDLPEEVLKNAERKHQANMLETLYQVLKKVTMNKLNIWGKNFVIFIEDLNPVTSVEFYVNYCKTYCNITVTDNHPIINTDYELKVVIDPKLISQIKSKNIYKIIFTLFSNDALFFSQDYYKLKESSKIIGVQISSDIYINLEGSVSVGYKAEHETDNHTCEFWQDDHWNQANPVQPMASNLFKCDFWNLGYYALRYNTINITHLIENTLNSNMSAIDTLKELKNITENYNTKFKAYDINLIATYLFEFKEANEEILIECTNIVTNVMGFKRKILRKSEMLYYSSTKLIKSVINFAEELEKTTVVCTSKLLVANILLTENDYSGIEIKNIEQPCMYELISNGIPSNNNLGIVVTDDFIAKLKNLTNVPKLIFAIYYNDALFNEELNNKNTSTIIGLKIPGYDLSFSEKIAVYYNKDTSNSAYFGCFNWKNNSWKLNNRIDENFTCNHYNQGYFTCIKNFNITEILENISHSNSSQFQISSALETASTFYDHFDSLDTSILSQIIINRDLHDLNTIKQIGINYFQIPSEIKQESQIKYNTTNLFLDFIYQQGFFLAPNTTYALKNYFQIVTCHFNKKNMFVTITNNSAFCSILNDTDLYARVHYVDNLTSDVLPVSVFAENDIFVDTEGSETSKIIGISPKEGTTVKISFNRNESKPTNYSCACWGFVPTENGNWTYTHTEKEDDYIICTISNRKCRYIALVNQDVSKILRDIFSSCEKYSKKISAVFHVITDYKNRFRPENINQVNDILNNGTIVEEEELRILVGIINKLMDFDIDILAASQDQFNATEKLLSCLDNLIVQYTGDAVILNYTNYALVIKSNISGLIFENYNKVSYTIKDVIEDNTTNNIYSNISLIIDSSLVKDFKETSSALYISVFFNDGLFNGRYGVTTKNQGIIVGVGVSNMMLNNSLRIYFKNYQNQTNVCAYWSHKIIDSNTPIGYWEIIPANPCENRMDVRYFALLEEHNVTNNLQDILYSNVSIDEKMQEVADVIHNNTENLRPVDIYLISKILENLVDYENTTLLEVDLTSLIMSLLFDVDRTILKESQYRFRATDSLLFTTDEVIKKCRDPITEPLVYSNFTITKVNIKDGNVTSLVLKNCSNYECDVKYLTNESINDVIENEDFATALVLSGDLLNQVQERNEPVYLIVTIHFYDNFFNQNPSENADTSKILGIIIEGLDNDIRGSIYMIYNLKHDYYENTSCAYWKYQVNNEPIRGYWKDDVSPTSKNEFIICEYDHLTHFVLLLANSGSIIENLNDSHILDIITNINSVLSLLGLFGILLTTVLFDRWRNNTGNQILINFSVALSIKNVMLYINEGIYTEGDKSMACTVTGAILHYSILSEFCWMLIIAILQFKRFVEVLGGPLKYVLLKACICAWVFPALPVFLTIIIDVNNYNKSEVGLCYPSGFGLYLGIWLPLVVIISINFVIFVFILYNVFHKKTEYREQVNHEIIFQWRLAILLFSILGLTWSFGFLSLIFDSSLFAILFCFLATLQGFIIFFVFYRFQ